MYMSLLNSSLKARVALFTLTTFLLCMVGLAVYASFLLRTDLKALLTEQQFETAKHLSKEIDGDLQFRLNALEQVAQLMGPAVMQNDVLAQRTLKDLPVFQTLFNGGSFITDLAGTAIASEPLAANRQGMNFSDRDYMQAVLSTGKAAIGRPVMGRALGVPVIVMAAPIRDKNGKTVGVLSGAINLNSNSFLDKFEGAAPGLIGDYLLVSRAHRIIITSSEKSRVMEVLPEQGVNPAIDRFIAGFEGTTTFINPQRAEVLASVKQVNGAPWYVAVARPTAQVFAAVDRLQERMLLAISLLALAAVALSWWMIRLQLRPLQEAALTLAQLSPDKLRGSTIEPLPISRPDEIGQLILSFNTLLDELSRQRGELEKSELLYSTAFETSPDAFSITRFQDGSYLKVNESFTRLFGWPAEVATGRTSAELGIWAHPSDRKRMVEALGKNGRCENLETEFRARGGKLVAVQISATLIDLEGVACILAATHDLSRHRTAQAQIAQLSFTDPLTALPNRRLFMDRLDQAVRECQRRQRRGALFFVNLDDFSSLNDSLGHHKGDLLLRATGQQLLGIAGPSGTVARLGADEFAVLIDDLPLDLALSTAQAEAVGARILEALSQPIKLEGVDYHGSACVGVTLLGGDAENYSDLLKQADLALHHAKTLGRSRQRRFTADMQSSLTSRAQLDAELRTALQENQLRLFYQPQVNHAGQPFGVEALLRWQHPTRGLVPPGEFIPQAEKSGFIVSLGQWVLEQACWQLAAWSKDPKTAALTIAVNVSSMQLHQVDFVDQVTQTLDASGADARLLKLELTESLLLDNIDDVVQKMRALRALGVCFSLDDFGTGFSSLAYLKSLPLTEIKIDQRFVRDIDTNLNDLAIARAVVALGNSLEFLVTAEGVETEAQRQALLAIGCSRYQGYLFGRPAPIQALDLGAGTQATATQPAA